MFWNVIEIQELPPEADLKAALLWKLDALKAEGWTIEHPEARYAKSFCNRNGERVLVGIFPRDVRST